MFTRCERIHSKANSKPKTIVEITDDLYRYLRIMERMIAKKLNDSNRRKFEKKVKSKRIMKDLRVYLKYLKDDVNCHIEDRKDLHVGYDDLEMEVEGLNGGYDELETDVEELKKQMIEVKSAISENEGTMAVFDKRLREIEEKVKNSTDNNECLAVETSNSRKMLDGIF